MGLATPLWNVARAERAGFDQLITPCSACLYHFKHAAKRVAEDPALRAEVEGPARDAAGPSPPTFTRWNSSPATASRSVSRSRFIVISPV